MLRGTARIPPRFGTRTREEGGDQRRRLRILRRFLSHLLPAVRNSNTVSGGVDTTLSGISQLILAMVLFPDKQAKAQEELDRVTGNGARLPDYEDEENLPYLSALLKEVMR